MQTGFLQFQRISDTEEGERETKYSYVSCQCEEKQLYHRICIVFGNEESGEKSEIRIFHFNIESTSERTSERKKTVNLILHVQIACWYFLFFVSRYFFSLRSYHLKTSSTLSRKEKEKLRVKKKKFNKKRKKWKEWGRGGWRRIW